ncbi:MAG: flagellar basal body P-ring formation chaperone FlgA [Pseudomonadota bacterium]
MIELLATSLLLGNVVAETRLRTGMIIEPAHVSGDASDIDPLVGRQVVRTIFPGRTLTYADTKEPNLVERNNVVRIIGRKGPLVVETKGRSLGAGTSGEEVTVINLESRRTVVGRIIGPNQVEVDL